jgi:two-component system response regulator AtoC
MQHLEGILHEIATTEVCVLLIGESGTGKDAYARQIHQFSLRKEQPFRKVVAASADSSSLSEALTHTGLGQTQPDFLGTLYLDNVHDLTADAQRVLLGFLCDCENESPDENKKVRFVASATSDLDAEVKFGRFRRELYSRLSGICLRIPPLRERVVDISTLMQHFLSKFSFEFKKEILQPTPEIVGQLSAYHWPGNIRELENVVRRAVILGDFHAVVQELQQQSQRETAKPFVSPGFSLRKVARAASKKAEREIIERTLERTHWNRKKAARELQISYKSLLCKIKEFEMPSGQIED